MKYFGTDGIRGVVGKTLTLDLVAKVGKAIALQKYQSAVIGWDTRKSSSSIVKQLTKTLKHKGLKVTHIGVVPTAALAFFTRELKQDIGIMITASHNPPNYNGIKLFAPTGEKLDEQLTGQIDRLIDMEELWQDLLVAKFAPVFKDKKLPRVVLDCANGSGSIVAQDVLKRLGFDVELHNVQTDGNNININCGAVYPGYLTGLIDGQVGFAFDGDADRCVAVDESGTVVLGDILLAALARHLKTNKFVTTVMFNTGTEKWLNSHGVEVIRTPVGDKYVYAELKKLNNDGAVFGGEPSGHIIFPSLFPSGDGLVTALTVLQMIVEDGRTLRELCADIPVWPGILRNVTTDLPPGEFWKEGCRVLVRKSGTENVTRVLVEGENPERCNEVLLDVIRTSLRENLVTSHIPDVLAIRTPNISDVLVIQTDKGGH